MSTLVLGPTQSAVQRVSRGDVRSVRVAGGAWNILPLLTNDYGAFTRTTLRSTGSPPAQQNARPCIDLVWAVKIFHNLCFQDQLYGSWYGSGKTTNRTEF